MPHCLNQLLTPEPCGESGRHWLSVQCHAVQDEVIAKGLFSGMLTLPTWLQHFAFSPLYPTLSPCAPLALGGVAWAALWWRLFLWCGRLCFGFEGLGWIQFVEMRISRSISHAVLTAEGQRLVQWCPLLRREQHINRVSLNRSRGQKVKAVAQNKTIRNWRSP